MAGGILGGSGGFINPSRVATPRPATSAAPATGYARLPGSLQRAMGPPRIPPMVPFGPAAAGIPLWPLALAFLAGSLTNLAVQALWNMLNGRPRQDPGAWGDGSTTTVPGGAYWEVFCDWIQVISSGQYCAPPYSPTGGSQGFQGRHGLGSGDCVGVLLNKNSQTANSLCAGSTAGPGSPAIGVTFLKSDGSQQFVQVNGPVADWVSNASYSVTNKLTNFTIKRGGATVAPPATWTPWQTPLPPAPAPEPLEEEPPAPLPPVAPPLAPPVTEPPPTEEPPADPGPGQTPVPRPGPQPNSVPPPFPWYLPFLPTTPAPGTAGAPTALPGSPGSLPSRLPTPAPVPTPAGLEVIGELVIGQPGRAPPATLEGIAYELGKIEQKTAYLARKAQEPAAGGGLDGLEDLVDLLNSIKDFLSGIHGAGSYNLAAPCQEGVTRQASWSAGTGSLNLLIKKVDAVAELIQHHKDLRQPVCATKASGQPVTVQFQEIG